MSRVPHFLENRPTDGGEIVSSCLPKSRDNISTNLNNKSRVVINSNRFKWSEALKGFKISESGTGTKVKDSGDERLGKTIRTRIEESSLLGCGAV
jgi:hypothetical protein